MVEVPARAERLAWCLAAADRCAAPAGFLDRALDAVAKLSRFRPAPVVAW